MSELKFYLARFLRRFPYFLVVATLISAVSVIVAYTLPPAYESTVRLIVESKQIPDQLAQATVDTPATEQLQIMQQRLLTRENLLNIANSMQVVRDQAELTPDGVVRAMRAQTTMNARAPRGEAPILTINFEAPSPQAAAGVLNAYLTIILEQDVQFRTERAETTMDFFEQQVEQLSQKLDEKSAQILEFKNANADALPETLQFRMAEMTRQQDRVTLIDGNIANLRNQREQLIRVAEAQASMPASSVPNAQLTPREQRVASLEQQLDDALTIYSEESLQVRQLRARIAQFKASIEAEQAANRPAATDQADDIAQSTAETGVPMSVSEELAMRGITNPMLEVQLTDIDSQIRILEEQKADIEADIEVLRDSIARTPANSIALDGLLRDYQNLQNQYNTASDRLSRASTGERIELLSRGQRITVIEPPAVPNEPTKPNRVKVAGMGSAAGILAGLALVLLIEALHRTPRRPEDIVARFDVMPIATIPYVRTSQQILVDRAIKTFLILGILIGVPAVIYAVHQYYMPLDQLADKVMTRFGVRW